MADHSAAEWQGLLSALAIGVIVLNEEGEILYANSEAETLFARKSSSLVGTPFARPREIRSEEIALLRPNGELIEAEITLRQAEWAATLAWIATLKDITQRKQDEGQLLLAAKVFSAAREGVLITSPRGEILEVNSAFSEISGYSREELLGQNPRLLKSGRHDLPFYRSLWQQLMREGFWRGEIWNRHKSGQEYIQLLTITAVRDEGGEVTHFIGHSTDISKMKAQEAREEFLTYYDQLTQLPNRMLLADRLEQAMAQTLRRQQNLVIAYLDLDGFAHVNKEHGQPLGDQLLMVMAERLLLTLRRGDTLARVGGDEFVVVLTDLSQPQESIPLLERLLECASSPVVIEDVTLQLSASLGISLYPQQERITPEQLLRQADQAMYQAKLGGKNRYHLFDTQQDQQLRAHHEMLEAVRSALALNQFCLYYQPKVNLHSGVVIGVEALIRWQHPELGLRPPGAFLPYIENHPLSIEIGEWVIATAIAQMLAWQRAGLEITVSVNVGSLQLQQPQFVSRLEQILKANPELKPERLELEILETSALENMDHVCAVLVQCRALGVRFSLDDFGTGYSSLAYLKRLPVHELKIDQGFVFTMLEESDNLAILDGIVGLAEAFQMSAIAEGIESDEHGELLLQLGCHRGQGFGIARPMAAAALPLWIEQWSPPESWSRQQRISRVDLPLLIAGNEHRNWLRRHYRALLGETAAQPVEGFTECNFGGWLYGEGKRRYGEYPDFLRMVAVHQQIHLLTAELYQQQSEGKEDP
ncbi:MAG: EAL domain-containing protein, partial [Gammaproteobacteria bacterium]|nr:EAL domain-containing protein [Gammaproteobacteria bacterium]